jgi:hypothetical protein
VHVDEAAGLGLAARESDFEFSSEPLNLADARAYGTTSKTSVRQTPAIGQAVTLRMELPQASRVVMPTAPSRRINAGVSSIWTK